MDFNTDVWPYIEKYGLPLLLAVASLIVGLYVIKMLVRFMKKRMEKADVDPSLRPFLLSLVSTILRICLVFSVVGMVGVETSSLVALLAAAGLAIGMALQGTLGNFAGGVMILFLNLLK